MSRQMSSLSKSVYSFLDTIDGHVSGFLIEPGRIKVQLIPGKTQFFTVEAISQKKDTPL